LLTLPIRLCLQRTVAGRGARISIIDERNVVTDETLVFDVHALTDKSVAGDFAVFADGGALLNLDKRAILVPSPISQPYKLTKLKILTSLPNFTESAMLTNCILVLLVK
jgi:hypothetical protein